jgi:hypothetical protein
MNINTAKRPRKDSAESCDLDDDATFCVAKRVRVAEDQNIEPCHFYKLPREIRDMICDRLWEATPLLFNNLDSDSFRSDSLETMLSVVYKG